MISIIRSAFAIGRDLIVWVFILDSVEFGMASWGIHVVFDRGYFTHELNGES